MNDIPLLGDGPYKGSTDVQAMHDDLAGQKSGPWRTHAQRWTNAGTALHKASGDLNTALNKVTIWQQSTGSEAWKTFKDEVTTAVTFLENWNRETATVALRLNQVADVLDGAVGMMDQYLNEWNQAKQKAASSDGAVSSAGKTEMSSLAFQAAFEMNLVSGAMSGVVNGLEEEFSKVEWTGPEVAKPGAPQPNDDKAGTGTNTDKAGAATDGGAKTAADDKSKQPDAKQPDAKDPLDEISKQIDTIGKGIDLIGKIPDNLDKWITLAQHAKDLVDPSTAATPTVTTDPVKSLTDGLLPDQPALAGNAGTTTAPTFHAESSFPPVTGSSHLPISSIGGGVGTGALGNGALGRVSSAGNTPVQKSATVAGTTGAEPELSGKASTTTSGTTQQSTPPMYPPQNGGMGAGGNGSRDIKSGGATGRRPGFNVPADQSEAERLRRQGVQSDLQGRTNGESRPASGVPPLRKRKRSATRTPEHDVLDEDLWRI